MRELIAFLKFNNKHNKSFLFKIDTNLYNNKLILNKKNLKKNIIYSYDFKVFRIKNKNIIFSYYDKLSYYDSNYNFFISYYYFYFFFIITKIKRRPFYFCNNKKKNIKYFFKKQ